MADMRITEVPQKYCLQALTPVPELWGLRLRHKFGRSHQTGPVLARN